MKESTVFTQKTTNGSIYSFAIVKIKTFDVAIVIDKNLDKSVSVTNNIEEIAKVLNTSKIIYKDSEEIYDYWEKRIGFRSLSFHSKPTKNLLDAIKIAEIGYIK